MRPYNSDNNDHFYIEPLRFITIKTISKLPKSSTKGYCERPLRNRRIEIGPYFRPMYEACYFKINGRRVNNPLTVDI